VSAPARARERARFIHPEAWQDIMPTPQQFIWHPPQAEPHLAWAADRIAAELARPKPPSRPRNLGWVELRVKPTSPRDELILLLKLAAEIEHALLVQYLYAMYSIDPDQPGSGAALRGTLRDIALQEMAHFLSVQNLLLAVGGPADVHIGRDQFRAGSQGNPMPFALEPLTSPLLLEKFVLVEMPATITDPDVSRQVAQMMVDVKNQLGMEPHRVGAVYTQIYWLIQPTDAATGDLHLTPDPSQGLFPGRHLTPDDFTDPAVIDRRQGKFGEWWGSSGPDMLILPVGDATTAKADLAGVALHNVFQIMGQGEGQATADNSHFERFLGAINLYQSGGAPATLPVAVTPYVGPKPTETKVTTPIVNPYTKLWAELLDLRYTMLLTDIGMTLSNDVGTDDRKTLKIWARADMRGFLMTLANRMTSPTLTSLGASGPTFGLLTEDVPADPRAQWVAYRGLLLRQTGVIAELRSRPELNNDSDGQDLATQIEQDATQKSNYIATKL
jgi:hypothetical protein